MTIDTPAQPTTKVGLDVIVSRADLESALAFTSVAIPNRPPVPVLTAVHLAAAAGTVTLSTFDYETHTWDTIDAPGARGSALLPHKTLQQIVKNFPKTSLTVTLRAEGGKVVVTDGVTTFRVLTLDELDWPDAPRHAVTPIFHLSGADFRTAISKVSTAASLDDTLPLLTLVKFDTSDGVTLYCTDRYRLAAYRIGQETPMTDAARSPLVSAKVLSALAPHFVGEDVRMYGMRTREPGKQFWVTILGDRRGATIQEHDGDYPSVQRLFPDPDKIVTTVDLDPADLAKALKQVGPAIVRNTPVRFDLQENKVVLRAGSEDEMTAERPLAGEPVHRPGGEVEGSAFNPKFLLDAVKACGGDVVEMALTHRSKPVLFTSPSDPNYRHLLVPIRFAD